MIKGIILKISINGVHIYLKIKNHVQFRDTAFLKLLHGEICIYALETNCDNSSMNGIAETGGSPW